MTKFNVVSAAKFNNALKRVSTHADIELIAHGALIQLSENNKNSDRLKQILNALVIGNGKPSAACKQITSYLKAQGLAYSVNAKTEKIKVKKWIDLNEAVTFTEFLAQEKPKKESVKKSEVERIVAMLGKVELPQALAMLEEVKVELLKATTEKAQSEAVEFPGLTANFEGKKTAMAH